MKTATTALQNYLNNLIVAGTGGGNVLVADLYTFSLLANGIVLRYTSWPNAITVGGHTFGSGTAALPDNAAGPWIERTPIKQSVGLSVDEVTIKMRALPSDLITGVSIFEYLCAGQFDGAAVKIERLFMPTPGDVSLGTVVRFVGSVANIEEIGRAHASLTVRSKTELLNLPMPRNVYQPSCRHILGDAGCGVDLSQPPFRVAGVVGAGSTIINIVTNLTHTDPAAAPTIAPVLSDLQQNGVHLTASSSYFAKVTYVTADGETTASPESGRVIVETDHVLRVASPSAATGVIGWNVYVGGLPGQEQKQNSGAISIGANWTMPGNGLVSGLPVPLLATDGYFDQGFIQFTSGVVAGVARKIERYGSGVITVLPPMPSIPVAGVTFNATAGCDRLMSTCSAKFNNLINYGGMPFVPMPEQAI